MSNYFHEFNINSENKSPTNDYVDELIKSSGTKFQQEFKVDDDTDEFLGFEEESDNYIHLDIQEAKSTQTEELIIYEDYPSAKDFLSLVTCPKEPELDHFNFYEDHSYALKMLSLSVGNISYLNSDFIFNDYSCQVLNELSSDSLSVDHFENEYTYDYTSEDDCIDFTFMSSPIHNTSEDEEIIVSEDEELHVSMTKSDLNSHSHTIANENLLEQGKVLTLKRELVKTNRSKIVKKKSNTMIYKKSVKKKDLPPKKSNHKIKNHEIMSNETDPLSLPCDDLFCKYLYSKPYKKSVTSYLKMKRGKCRQVFDQHFIEAKDVSLHANFQNSFEFNDRLKKNIIERDRRSLIKVLLQDLAWLVTEYDYSNKLPPTAKILFEATKAVNAYKEIDLERTKQIELKNKYLQLVKLVS